MTEYEMPATALARTLTAFGLAAMAIACTADRREQSAAASTSVVRGLPTHLQVQGGKFVAPDGRVFQWRGVTAFRLLEFIANGREAEALAFLDWAKRQQLTVVRVLTMMAGQFVLSPAEGRRALPRLLDLAAARGLYVEVVAFAGTADISVNLEEHIDQIARVLAAHPNGLLEVANEPVHPSQSAEVQRADVLTALAKRVSSEVPVSLGSIERGDGFGAGSYITWHAPRESGRDGWGHVLALVQGADLSARWKKPIISDEPIGAGKEFQPGRRDNEPSRFRAAAILTRLIGLGATFHYEGGLQARIPDGRERECFEAWNEAWTLLPENIEQRGAFGISARPGSIVTSFDTARAMGVFERVDGNDGWILLVGDAGAPLTMSAPWSIRESREIPGGRWLSVSRAKD